MYKYILLITITLIFAKGFAQHKTITLYYPNDSTNVVSIANLDSIVIFICGASKVNYEGQSYNTVLIGNQCWLKENLNAGVRININQNASDNDTIQKSCYNDLEANCNIYGGLYHWHEAMQYSTTEGVQGICPAGWHIPTDAELHTLNDLVSASGNALKEIGQGTGDGAGTNTSGFSGLLSGYRHFNSHFAELTQILHIWSSTIDGTTNARHMYLNYLNNSISYHVGQIDGYAFSVRCIRD